MEFSEESIKVTRPRVKQMTKNSKKESSFFITDPQMVARIDEYIRCFPQGETKGRFFRTLRNGKATKCPIGVNKIAEVPRRVASFLKKESPNLYTGHCFRRTGACILAEQGLSVTMIKNAGDWQSTTVAEGYVDNSDHMKRTIASAFNAKPSSESQSPPSEPPDPLPFQLPPTTGSFTNYFVINQPTIAKFL